MIRGVMFDIAGVLIDGNTAVPGAAEAVARVRRAGLAVRFLTNTTRRPRRLVLERLRARGIEVETDEVLTPAAAVCRWLEAQGHAPHLLVHPDLEEDFAGCTSEGPTAVVVGDAGPGFTYESLNTAYRIIAAGPPFLALAANRVFRDDDGQLSLDAGAFVRALEYASDTEARVFGKPAAAFFMAAVRGMGCEPGAVAMIGDDAEADVFGALSAGLGAAYLVRTGKYQRGDEDRCDPKPTAVVADVREAVETILRRRGS